jgi:hypothetical protein
LTDARNLLTLRVLPGAINGLINGALAWMVHGNATSIGLWTEGAYAIDLMVTGFLLPSISWLIVRPVMRKQASAGYGPDIAALPTLWLRHCMPTSLWGGALAIGAVGTLLGTVMVLVMQALGGPSFSGTTYVAFKSGYSALLAVILQPTLVFAAQQSLVKPAARTSFP